MVEGKGIENIQKSVFNTLYEIDTRDRSVEKDTGRTKLTYLPWATTYSEAAKAFEDLKYEFVTHTEEVEEVITTTIDENTTKQVTKRYSLEIPYTRTALGLKVDTKVTINGIEKTMWLPVYNANFKSMDTEPYTYSTNKGSNTVQAATIADVYKSIMRCFAKNLSMFGIGLYFWTKEDAPENILKVEKLQNEIDTIAKKKCGLSEKAKNEVKTTCMKYEPEAGNYLEIQDESVLGELLKELRKIRK